jgi:hypothetical protein
MKTCTLQGFMDELGPWIDRSYIRSASLDGEGNVTLLFTDGVEETFAIEGCSKDHVREILAGLQKRGIPIQ